MSFKFCGLLIFGMVWSTVFYLGQQASQSLVVVSEASAQANLIQKVDAAYPALAGKWGARQETDYGTDSRFAKSDRFPSSRPILGNNLLDSPT
jgi:hypothetical protein